MRLRNLLALTPLTADKIMQAVAGRPWDLWKAKALGKS
jgi:hypothetical protein